MPKISVVIIHYNTPHFLKTCIDSVLSQTHKNIEIIFIDNNSPDSTGLDYVREKYSGLNPNLKIIGNHENLGFARAANQGIKLSTGKYVAITNPDIIYTPDYFAKTVERIEQNPEIAAITGKVYKYDFEGDRHTKIIDSVGLFAYKNRRIIDDGQGLIDEGQFDEECEVFGISGACPLYRRDALEDVKVLGEYFDEDFFMYKEDVDLAWRLLLYGWKSIYFPHAVAYHGRGTGIRRRFFNKEVLKNRKHLSKFQKKHSFRNQHLMQLKNELPGNFFSSLLPIVLRKFATAVYITFREPYLWGSYLSYLALIPRTLKKRRVIMKNRKKSSKEMGRWFRKQSRYLSAS